jgi:hypothetical protein
MERMASVTEMTAFVKNLLANACEVVGFLEGVHRVRRGKETVAVVQGWIATEEISHLV